MQKIAASDAKIFKVADTVYDNVAAVLRNVASQPKTVFRAVFTIACFVGVGAMTIGVGDAVDSEIKRQEFNETHATLLAAINGSAEDVATKQKYTMEQRALAVKMFTCAGAGAGNRHRREEFCAAQIVADAAIAGGEQRALTTKSNLKELGFSVRAWL